ncbi:MAG: hypothetical protein WC829_01270 [Hyphomicrobium sp.]|jgi:hypothetical protein
MAEAALKITEKPAPLIRRFDTADLSQHGAWVVPRMLQAFPHLNERGVASFLQTIIYNNEYLLLFSDDGIALAQVMSAHTLTAKPVVQERFVWVADKEDKDQIKRGAEFYVEFYRWAKTHGAEVIVVEENTDIPHELIKEKLGRIFTRQQQFARL